MVCSDLKEECPPWAHVLEKLVPQLVVLFGESYGTLRRGSLAGESILLDVGFEVL